MQRSLRHSLPSSATLSYSHSFHFTETFRFLTLPLLKQLLAKVRVTHQLCGNYTKTVNRQEVNLTQNMIQISTTVKTTITVIVQLMKVIGCNVVPTFLLITSPFDKFRKVNKRFYGLTFMNTSYINRYCV